MLCGSAFLNDSCARWSARSADELKALPQITYHRARSGNNEIEYALWHVNPEEDWCFDEQHSFVLQAQRSLLLFGCINHLAGFALDEDDAIVPHRG